METKTKSLQVSFYNEKASHASPEDFNPDETAKTSRHSRTDRASQRVIKTVTDMVVEVMDSAPSVARAAESLAAAIPARRPWVRQTLSICCLGAAGLLILTYSSYLEERKKGTSDRDE